MLPDEVHGAAQHLADVGILLCHGRNAVPHQLWGVPWPGGGLPGPERVPDVGWQQAADSIVLTVLAVTQFFFTNSKF